MSSANVFRDGKIQVTCSACNRRNAVHLEKLLAGPVCGACGARLPAIREPVALGDADLEGFLRLAPVPVLVDFWAPWCGPCRMMTPLIDRMAQKKAGELLVAKVNTDESPRAATELGIRGVPTLIVFRQNRETVRQVGAVPEGGLERMVA